jgi:hypothetical protein
VLVLVPHQGCDPVSVGDACTLQGRGQLPPGDVDRDRVQRWREPSQRAGNDFNVGDRTWRRVRACRSRAAETNIMVDFTETSNGPVRFR